MSEYPMVEQVNRLIGNRLATGGELFLPGVGSLHTERRGARRISKRMVEPPFRMVVFSSQPRGEALPELIARAASCDEATAQDIYARWLEQTSGDGVLTVGGVGVLKLKHFQLDEAFDRRLNPQGRKPVRIRSLHRFDWALWCGVAAIVFAALFGGYQFLMLFPDEPAGQVVVAESGSDPGQAAVPADTLAPAVADSLTLSAGPGAPASAEGAELPASGSEQAEKGASGGATSVDNRTEIAVQTDNAAALSAQQTDNADRQAAAPQPAARPQTSVPTGTAAEPTIPAASDRPAPLVSGRKYVVLGVFSTPENAARAVRTAASATPALPCRVYRFGEKFMVSPFESDDAAACARFIGERKGRYRDLWTYTAR